MQTVNLQMLFIALSIAVPVCSRALVNKSWIESTPGVHSCLGQIQSSYGQTGRGRAANRVSACASMRRAQLAEGQQAGDVPAQDTGPSAAVTSLLLLLPPSQLLPALLASGVCCAGMSGSGVGSREGASTRSSARRSACAWSHSAFAASAVRFSPGSTGCRKRCRDTCLPVWGRCQGSWWVHHRTSSCASAGRALNLYQDVRMSVKRRWLERNWPACSGSWKLLLSSAAAGRPPRAGSTPLTGTCPWCGGSAAGCLLQNPLLRGAHGGPAEPGRGPMHCNA